ncbi:MAG: hypothetical protein U1F76_22590 [Candidatus Competibacteraceae bacterium]
MANPPLIHWHRLLGALLDAVLSPVGVSVEIDIAVTAEPPRADLLLLRRDQPYWNNAQRQRLADGLRDTDAGHLLLEFKYTEGLSENAFVQLLSYDYFYRCHRRLARDEVACFLVSATTPRSDLLTRLGFHPTDRAGVYGRNDHPLLTAMQVILLNELTPAAHNAFLKCFASRRREQEVSFRVLQHHELLGSSPRVECLLYGLWRLLMKNAPEMQEITPEYVMQLGQELIDAVLDFTPADQVMKHFTAEERLAGLDPKDRLAGLTPDQIRRYLEQLEKSNPQ